MCGICGVVYSDSERPVDPDMLRRMTEIMVHRGPDSHGYYTAPGIGFGVRRLSIIDLETGDQPISNEDGTVTVVCNGEIYNFPELRQELLSAGHRFRTRSDVEVIVHLYEDYGVECLHRLRGMFGFALWDTRRRRLMLARDRLGIKPVHYAVEQDGCYFASEMKSILIGDQVERQLDVRALQDLFTFGFALGPRTFFTRIRRLQPGHYLLYHDGVASTHKYWDVTFPEKNDRSPHLGAGEWAESLLEKLRESVRIHLRSDVPAGAWLSAGIDSSSVARLMSESTERPVQTFTLAFEDLNFDEVHGQNTLDAYPGYDLPNSREICTGKDLALLPKALWHCEDHSTTGLEIPHLILSESASRRVKVVLTGEGSDEMFGGYRWFQVDKLLRPLAWVPLSLRRLMLLGPLIPKLWPGASRAHLAPRQMNLLRYAKLIAPLQVNVRQRFFSPDLEQEIAITRDQEPVLVLPDGFQNWHPFCQLQYYEIKIRLPDYIVHHLDRMSMAHSLEVRVPFLDHELVEFCARIPPRLKMRGLKEKYILRKAMRGVLPKEIVQRRKRGLRAPVDSWFENDLPEFAVDLLLKERLREKGYFSPDFVAHMLREHRAGAKFFAAPLLGVLVTQLWDELFMKGCRPNADSATLRL